MRRVLRQSDEPLWRVPLAILYTVDFFIILGVSALSYHLLEMPFLRLKESRHNKLISLRVADLMDYAQSSGGGAD